MAIRAGNRHSKFASSGIVRPATAVGGADAGATGLGEAVRLALAGVLELGGVWLGIPDVTRALPQALNATRHIKNATRRIDRFDCLLGIGDREVTTT
jgi:hypothetical protein